MWRAVVVLSAAAAGAATVAVLAGTSAAASETAGSARLTTTTSPRAAAATRQVASTPQSVASTAQRVAPAPVPPAPQTSVPATVPATSQPLPAAAGAPTVALRQENGVKPALAPQQAKLLDPSQLVVSGVLACELGSNYTVTVTITELGSQTGVRESTVATGPCSATAPQPWTVTVRGNGGKFVPVLTTYGKIVNPTTKKVAANVDQRGITFA